MKKGSWIDGRRKAKANTRHLCISPTTKEEQTGEREDWRSGDRGEQEETESQKQNWKKKDTSKRFKEIRRDSLFFLSHWKRIAIRPQVVLSRWRFLIPSLSRYNPLFFPRSDTCQWRIPFSDGHKSFVLKLSIWVIFYNKW